MIPWDGSVPSDLRAEPGTPAAPCRASQLRAEGKGFVFSPAIVGGTGSATLRNTGSSPCSLTGRPVVRFVGAPKAPRQRQVALPPRAATFPTVLPAAETLNALPPGRAATVSVDWRNWCVPGAARTHRPLRPPRAVRVTLAHGAGSLDVPYNAVAPCDAPGEPSTIGVRPFQPAPLPARRPWTATPVRAAIRSLDGARGPLHARRGAELRYVVDLRNASRTETVRFDRCPIFVESIAPAGLPESHETHLPQGPPDRPR